MFLNYPLVIEIYYVLIGAVLVFLFYLKTGRFFWSTIGALSSIFVLSEYWEIPIFVYGYLGLNSIPFPHWSNHIFIAGIFFFFFIMLDVKLSWRLGFFLTFGILANFVLFSLWISLPFYWSVATYYGLLGRLIGFFCFSIGCIPEVGLEASS